MRRNACNSIDSVTNYQSIITWYIPKEFFCLIKNLITIILPNLMNLYTIDKMYCIMRLFFCNGINAMRIERKAFDLECIKHKVWQLIISFVLQRIVVNKHQQKGHFLFCIFPGFQYYSLADC
jgi:hypothetical protein